MTISNAELNRRKRVCQMCPDFQTRDNGIRTWCGRDCHGEDGKHCEVWAQFQWSKRILGPEDPCKYWENPLMQNSAILLPYVGEFGWMIQEHVRWAHAYQAASKRIWCQAGQECLFPSATAFFTDWSNPIPEDRRCWSTDWYDRGARDRFYDQLRPRLQLLFPNEEIITPQYGCRWHMSDAAEFKFRPQVRGVLPAVDVAIGPRMREFDAGRNWPHWQAFAKLLRASGIVVGVVGAPATSSSVEADVRAWQHPDGIDAGCIDVLSHCKLYVGVDSGVSHLAALVDAPTLLIERDNPDDGAGEADIFAPVVGDTGFDGHTRRPIRQHTAAIGFVLSIELVGGWHGHHTGMDPILRQRALRLECKTHL